MLHNQQSAGRKDREFRHCLKSAFVDVLTVPWRIDKRDIESKSLAGANADGLSKVHLQNLISFCDPERLKVFANDAARPLRVFGKNHKRCPPAQRLDPDSAGAGTAVEKSRTGHAGPQDVKDRLLQLVARRADSLGRRGFETAALEVAGNDSHGHPTVTSPAGPTPRDRADKA